MNRFRKLVPVAAGAAGVSSAFAQSTGAAATFTSTIANLTNDVTAYGAALVVFSAVGVAFMIGIKYIQKIRGAA